MKVINIPTADQKSSRRAQLYRDPFFKKWDEVSVAFKEGCQDVVTINHAKEAFLHTREMHPRQHMTECSCHALRGVIGPHGANGKDTFLLSSISSCCFLMLKDWTVVDGCWHVAHANSILW